MRRILFYLSFLIVGIIIMSACKKNFTNPYDENSSMATWEPDSINYYILETSKCKITWKQNIKNIDGFKIDKKISGNWESEYAVIDKYFNYWTDSTFVYDSKNIVNYRIYAFAFKNCSKKQEIIINPDLPIVSTDTQIIQISTIVNIGGYISEDKKAFVFARGICWDSTPNPTIVDNHTIDGNGKGIFKSSLTGLKIGTLYYARAYATNIVGTGYGQQVSFTTNSLPKLSTIIYGVTLTTATIEGYITSDGGSIVTDRGVCWSISANPTLTNSKIIVGTGIGIYKSLITGLIVGNVYYARAYATNSIGTTYGNQVSFSPELGIGDTYQGGIIAYVLKPGDPGYLSGQKHGLIAAPSDQSAGIQWHNGSFFNIGGTDTAFGTGSKNTDKIVSSQGVGNYAAKLCSDLSLGGYSDWYLPSIDELGKITENYEAIGATFFFEYWSSSEFSVIGGDAAFSITFGISQIDGGYSTIIKDSKIKVRAIRSY